MENSHCSDCLLSIPLTTSEMADKIWGTDLALFSAWPNQTLFLTLVGQSCRNDGFCWIPCRSAPSWANSAHVCNTCTGGRLLLSKTKLLFYHLYLQVPKEGLWWETSSCFSRASKSPSRGTYLGWEAVPRSEVRSAQGGECPLPLTHTEDGRWQMCHGYATRDFHLLES